MTRDGRTGTTQGNGSLMEFASETEHCGEESVHGPHEWLLSMRRVQCPGTPIPSLIEVGIRVVITGRDTPYSGEIGTITNSPGKVFNGWTVLLDSGPVIGVDRKYLRPVMA